jgi:hypothetical protein
MPNILGKKSTEILRAYGNLRVMGAKVIGCNPCVWPFIDYLLRVEPDCESVKGVVSLLRRKTQHTGGIDAAAQKYSNRYVTDQMTANAPVK